MARDYGQVVGANIASARRQQGIRQDVLAERIGVSKTQLSDWEHGRNLVRLDAFATIAKALGVSSDRLLFGEEEFWKSAIAAARKQFEPEIEQLRRELAEVNAARLSR